MLQGSNINLQGGQPIQTIGQSSPQQSIQAPQAQIPQQTPQTQQTAQDNSVSQPVIPTYLNRNQARSLLQIAQQKGIDPAAALKSLVSQGHVIQGINDQDYNPQPEQDLSAPPENLFKNDNAGLGNKLLNFGSGIVKGLAQAGKGATDFLGKITGVKPAAEFSDQQLAAGPGEKIGSIVGRSLPAVGAGLATGGVSELPILTAAAVGAGTQGATELIASGGDTNSATKAAAFGAIAPIIGKAISPFLGKLSGKVPYTIGQTSSETVGDVFYNDIVPAAEKANSTLTKEFGNFVETLSSEYPEAKVSFQPADLEQLQNIATKNHLPIPASVQSAIDSMNNFKDTFGTLGKEVPPAEFSLKDAFDINKILSPKAYLGDVQAMQNSIKQAISGNLSPEDSQAMSEFLQQWGTKKTIATEFGKYFKTGTSKSAQDEVINNLKTLLSGDAQGGVKALTDFQNTFNIPLMDKVKAAQFAAKLPVSKGKLLLHLLEVLGIGGGALAVGKRIFGGQ